MRSGDSQVGSGEGSPEEEDGGDEVGEADEDRGVLVRQLGPP